MATTYHLQIVTPDHMAFDGQAERILLRTVEGDICILAHHIDYAAPLGIGVARMTDAEGNVREAACNGGLVSVHNGEVRVMAATYEWADEIDLARAEKAQQKAQEKLNTLRRNDQEYWMMEAKLKRAITRIHVKQ